MDEQKVRDLEAQLDEARRELAHEEFPKWVAVHESQIVHKSDGNAPAAVSVLGYAEWHVDRDGTVTVKVNDEAEEARAKEDKSAPVAEAEATPSEGNNKQGEAE